MTQHETKLPLTDNQIHEQARVESAKWYPTRPGMLESFRTEAVRDQVRFEDGYMVGYKAALEHIAQQSNGATLQRLIERVLHAEAPESNCWPSCGCAYNGNDIVSVCDRHAPGMCFSVCAVCGDRHISDEQRAALDSWMSSVQQAQDAYTPEQERVAKYLNETIGVGGGEDPIGFLIASHAAIIEASE